ncbi:MAG: adenylate kinase [Oscillospiraceae bacterium]|nr:adenylate kinase [Oscillospiraceae bacterium]
MKRAIVIGCPGAGKSTFSRALRERTGLPLYYMDMLFWNADKTYVSREVLLERIHEIVVQDEWIIDGNYCFSLEVRMKACDTVFFLDYPVELCLASVDARRGTVRPDMPWVEEEEDKEFTEFIKAFSVDNRPIILELLDKYPEKEIFWFQTREDADAYLQNMK